MLAQKFILNILVAEFMPTPGLQQVQRLGLQQTLSPQMQQSLHILQIPAMELSALIRQELTANPVLEETATDEVAEKTAEETADDAADNEDEEFEELAKLDEEWRDYFNQTTTPIRRSEEEEKNRQTFFESIAKAPSLQEHLLEQLQEADVEERFQKICEVLIGNIDERGYLIASDEDLKNWSGTEPGAAEAVLRIIQSLDPIGVGARDLRECLMLQLQRLGHREDSLPMRMVSGHIDSLAAKHYAEISEALNVSLDEVHRAGALISTLNPQPGSRFSLDEDRYITADMVVQKVGDEWVVIMNDDWMPSIRISNTYKDILGQSSQATEVKSYVRERLRSAKYFIKSIQQRRHTVVRIANEIVSVQVDFFNNGAAYLKPLTMTEVAQRIGVHETTVSRAIANKYMQTPHGIFELKYFFTPGIRRSDGGSITQDEIKSSIADLVGTEPADKPLTDQDIMQALKQKGIPIARRTVAKYREELKILPSHQRRNR
jgi:RNA polymerase sigma-54 factor